MESYIIRIYRREKNDPHKVAGIIEKVGQKGGKVFSSYDELREFMISWKKKNTKTPGPEDIKF